MSRALLAAQNPVLDWWALASALHRLSSTISMMVVLMIGALLVSRGELRIGDIVAFTGFATLLISRLDQVSAFVNQIFDARVKLEEFYKLEDDSAAAQEPAGLRELEHVTGHVRFENVGFEFANSGQGVDDISFEVQAGPDGRHRRPDRRRQDDADQPAAAGAYAAARPHPDRRHRHRARVTRKSLRQSIATVFQDAGLFNRSIEENIRIGRASAGYDEVHAAAEAAAAHDFILAKSEGYDTRGRRARRPAVGRRAPAHRDRPRHPQGRADPGAGRGDQRARRRNRGAGQGRDRPAARRTARPSSSRTG